MSLTQMTRSIFSFFIMASLSFGQSTGMPKLVESSIGDETIAVIRIDLSEPKILEASKLISSSLDPIGPMGQRFTNLDRTIQALAANQVKEVYAVTSTDDLPKLGATLVIPLGVTEEQHSKILNDLKKIWAKEIQDSPNGILISSSTAPPTNPSTSKAVRPEFSAGLSAVKDHPLQLVISLGSSSKRVLRDTLPSLIGGIDANSTTAVAGGWDWAAFGVGLGTKRQLKMIVQTKDDASADQLKQTFDQATKFVSGLAEQMSQSRRISDVIGSMKLTKDSNRLSLTLSEDDDLVKALLDDLALPLASQGVKESLEGRIKQNLKDILLALHNYHDTYNTFPPRAKLSKDGKPLLSWRVAILPWLGEGELYNQFWPDEAWDGPHNKLLIQKMPPVFASPNVSPEKRAEGMTTYLGIIAKKSLFSSDKAITIRQIRDGTSNTIAIIDAKGDHAVPWTKPEDLFVNLEHPQRALFGETGEGIWAGICDGSVLKIRAGLKATTLRQLIQIDDGEATDQEFRQK